MLKQSSVLTPAVFPYPVSTNGQTPSVTAQGVYIVDVDSMVPLLAKNPDESLRPASITKVMTALVAIDTFGQSDVVTAKDTAQVIGKAIHLTSGEQVAFEDMLYGLLLESGNDAAYALAENYPGGYQAMIEAMNRKSREFGLENTTYQNVSGVDQFQHETTVRDLTVLTALAMKNELFQTIVGTKDKEILSLDGNTVHRLTNTNELLGMVDGVKGVKTGWTALAGECLVTYLERDGRRVIIVLLGSQDRFGETTQLIDWVFSRHQWTLPFT